MRAKCYGSTLVFQTGGGSSTLPVRTYKLIPLPCGVTGSTADFESACPGSNPGGAIWSVQLRPPLAADNPLQQSNALAEQPGVLATLSRWRSPVRIRPGVLTLMDGWNGIVAQWQRRTFQTRQSVSSSLTGASIEESEFQTQHRSPTGRGVWFRTRKLGVRISPVLIRPAGTPFRGTGDSDRRYPGPDNGGIVAQWQRRLA